MVKKKSMVEKPIATKTTSKRPPIRKAAVKKPNEKMGPSTLIIVGAGMSEKLGLPTTKQINDIISDVLDVEHEGKPRSIDDRLASVKFKKYAFDKVALKDIKVTLSLLFDGDGAKDITQAYTSQDEARKNYLDVFTGHLSKTRTAALRHHLIDLPKTYDLISLKSLIYSVQRGATSSIDIVDILTAIQSSIEDNISIPTREIFPEEREETKAIYYCDRKRLTGALNAYKLLVYKIFKHLLRKMHIAEIPKYEDFFYEISKKHSGLEKLDDIKYATNKNRYISDVGFLTYNWDPVLPFLSMKANKKLNDELLKKSGKKGVCKKVYADYGIPFAGVKLSGEHTESAVYSFSEDAAFLINAFTKDSYTKYKYKKSKILTKIVKLFTPHGLLNVRICPRCQNGFFIFPENISDLIFSEIANLFTSDPIPSEYDLAFISSGKYNPILSKYEEGQPDEISCPSCEHPVYFEHSFLEIQSIIKGDKPATVNKIQFDYAEFFSRANHVIAIGYSFPKDDILNSVFLRNMKARKDDLGSECKLTYIGSPDKLYSDKWYQDDTLDEDKKHSIKQITEVIYKIFKKENTRFNFMGFPDVLKALEVKEILNWHF